MNQDRQASAEAAAEIRRTLVERVLALILIVAALLLCWVESRSSLAAAVREQTPWLFWLAARPSEAAGETPLLFLAFYHPGRPALDLVYLPPETRLEAGTRLGEVIRKAGDHAAAGARSMAEAAWRALLPDLPLRSLPPPAFLYAEPSSWPEGEVPVACKEWLSAETQGLPFWKGIRRWVGPGGDSSLGAFERLLLALELHRLPPEAIRPAWLPERDLRRALLGRMLTGGGRRPEGPISVEVLNATGRKGVASKATKILRLGGADVLSFGNAPAPGAKTLIYDRTGAIEKAAAVGRMLDCPSAQALTRIDPKRLVDVTVVIAEDCARDR